MKTKLQVIHIEDSSADSELVETLLLNGGLECNIRRVQTRGELVDALADSKCDVILSDCSLPQFNGLEALQIAREKAPQIPFIFVSGTIGEETAVNSLQKGATDYVLKQGLSRLVPAVRRALTEAESKAVRASLEAQLRQARKLETIGTLLGGVAHDFRNLLQILKLNMDLLPMVANEPEQVLQVTKSMSKTVDRGCDMMKELLVFARKSDPLLAPLELATRIRETAGDLRDSLPDNVALSLYLEEDLPAIMADGSQFDRMLTNLVVNAGDAMPEGGAIDILLDAVRFDVEHTSTWRIEDAPYLRVRVTDTGTGIDEATQARLFEPFFTTKPAGKGTGLGLSVVFGLMEAHQGFIDFQTEMGKGTTFSLFFPLTVGTTMPPERAQLIQPNRLLGRTEHAAVQE